MNLPKIRDYLFLITIFPIVDLLQAEQRLDGWYELNNVASAAVPSEEGEPVEGGTLQYDTTDMKNGDFSIRYEHQSPVDTGQIALLPYPYSHWKLSTEMLLHLWIKVEGRGIDKDRQLQVILRDQGGNHASYTSLESALQSGEWVEREIPLQDLRGIAKLDLDEILELSVAVELTDGNVLKIDDVYFYVPERKGSVLGVTDKSVLQRMKDARDSRERRARSIYRELASRGGRSLLSELWAEMWLGNDLDEANKRIVDMLLHNSEAHGFSFPWSLTATPWLYRMYLTYGPGEGSTNGRLSPEAETVIRRILWERTLEKNDIHWARARSPWWMDGSENHDLNMVVSNYISSMIFMELSEYADRVFPNKGTGGGAGYWFHRGDDNMPHHGPYGGAEFSDGKEYLARDHYVAWGDHLKEVFRERARKGFFLEQASPSYMKYTLSYIQDIYEFTDDPEMEDLVGSFLDLVWSTWALESLHGQRGGAKTRDHLSLDVRSDSMYNMARFQFGGMLGANAAAYHQLPAMRYEFPEIVWHLALDREGLGEFASISRAIGEEPGALPRKPGLERTMNLDTDHRMFRYAWVTPEYILGAQMDHPLAIHSHLSPTSRLFGLNFATHPDARIFPYGVKQDESGDWELVRRAGLMYRAIQHENVLLVQQSRNFTMINPEWYPLRDTAPLEYGLYFSPLIDRIVERDGWVFVEEGDAFAAIRIISGLYRIGGGVETTVAFLDYVGDGAVTEPLREKPYIWSENRTLMISEDPLSPIIYDCSNRRHYPNLEAFMEAVTDNRLELRRTVVPGWYILAYEGTGREPAELHLNLTNNEIPKVNGKSLDYTPGMLFDSPFIKSVYNSGSIRLQKGEVSETLNFLDP